MNEYRTKDYMWLFIILMVFVIAILSGCSTVAGVGKDIQNTAEWTKEKMGGK